MPLDTMSNLEAPTSNQPFSRALATVWRVVASLAGLAGIWTLVQLAHAIQAGGVKDLIPSASIIYAAGIGYLALTAIIALRFDRSIRAGRAPGHSPLLWLAHILVVVSSLSVAWRGISARGILVGLGASLVAWGVVAILALVAEIATWLARNQLATVESAPATSTRPVSSMASACLGCVAVLGLSLAYLESRPLPNLPDKPHVPTGLEAGGSVTQEKSVTHDEPAASSDS